MLIVFFFAVKYHSAGTRATSVWFGFCWSGYQIEDIGLTPLVLGEGSNVEMILKVWSLVHEAVIS